jgi:hypothetical protein
MKFCLTYDGELPSTGNRSRKIEKKWEIREQFHPQLEELWRINPALRRLANGLVINTSMGAFTIQDVYHGAPTNQAFSNRPPIGPDEIDLCGHINKFGHSFKPLVRETFALACGLKILFLRREPPGNVYKGGDLDNRLKTLLDALSVPENEGQVSRNPPKYNPLFCLAESDKLFTSISVSSERLLTGPSASDSHARLIIEVDVRVTDNRNYNSMFLGD